LPGWVRVDPGVCINMGALHVPFRNKAVTTSAAPPKVTARCNSYRRPSHAGFVHLNILLIISQVHSRDANLLDSPFFSPWSYHRDLLPPPPNTQMSGPAAALAILLLLFPRSAMAQISAPQCSSAALWQWVWDSSLCSKTRFFRRLTGLLHSLSRITVSTRILV
jgi:hypothetical protein